MASAKYEGGKCHGSAAASAYLRHNDPTPESRARVLAAKTAAGEDCHIDPAKSHLNKSVCGLTYDAAFKKYKRRVEEIEAMPSCRNRRKDRVTLQAIEVPVPEGLPRDKYDEFLGERIPAILREMYGEENFIDGTIHWDEEHEYIDPETKEKRMSRVHAHYDLVPEHDGDFAGKWFSKRSNIIRLNAAIDDMCQEEYGVSFHTGTKRRSRKKVADLKAESRLAKAEVDIANADNELANLELAIRQATEKAYEAALQEARETAYADVLEDIGITQQMLTTLENSLIDREDKVAVREDAIAASMRDLDEREAQLDDREAAFSERVRAKDVILRSRENAVATSEARLKADRTAFDQERQTFTAEKKRWQETADKRLEGAKKYYEDAKAGYERARTSYELAADKAAGVASGFSLDTIDKYTGALRVELQRRCEGIRNSSGRTLWDTAGRVILQALQDSTRATTERTAPAVLQAQRTRTTRAERGLPALPEGYAADGYTPEF